MAGTDKTGKEPPPRPEKRGEQEKETRESKEKPAEPPKDTSNPGPRVERP
jgi:hypothetical protein